MLNGTVIKSSHIYMSAYISGRINVRNLIHTHTYIHYIYIYRVEQEECAILREGVP